MALLVQPLDLNKAQDLSKVFIDAQDTIKYLQDIVESLSVRVLDGEEIKGLKVVEGRRTRYITDEGLQLLATELGADKVYETIKKPITLTKLEDIVDGNTMKDLERLGYIDYKSGKLKVVAE